MKKKKIRIISFVSALLIVAMLCLYGCGTQENNTASGQAEPVSVVQMTDKTQEAADTDTVTEYFTERDLNAEYDESTSTLIILQRTSAETEDKSISITDGSIIITQEGTYLLRGEYQGQIVVDTDQNSKVQLVLDGVTIDNIDSAAIYVAQADKVFVTLAEGSENKITNQGSFANEETDGIDGVIYSKDDLTVNGTGSLTIVSASGCGIVSNDDLKITNGIISITSARDGLQANDCICMTTVNLTIDSQGDAVQVENTEDTALGYLYIQDGSYTIKSQKDGFVASGEVLIADGTFDVTTGEGSQTAETIVSAIPSEANAGFVMSQRPSMGNRPQEGGREMPAQGFGEPPQGQEFGKQPPQDFGMMQEQTQTESNVESQKGIKSDSTITIQNGEFRLNCIDDGIHANGDMYLNGGTFTISSDDDAIHADGILEVNDGTYQITAAEGFEATVIRVNGGSAQITASDDGINAGQKSDAYDVLIEINGGDISISMGAGDTDGIDSNGDIVMNGGIVRVSGQFAFDYDGTATYNGGTLIVNGEEMKEIPNSMMGMW